mmetsp:Transcript_105168/g.279918  ORF Transcript_105168/g.279918 Transcript_105168/m.279918 type:complete len:574 (-) Transcript_105168:92-1813(-)
MAGTDEVHREASFANSTASIASRGTTPCHSPQAVWSGRSIVPLEEPAKPTKGALCCHGWKRCMRKTLKLSKVAVKVLGIGVMLLVLVISLFGGTEALVSNDIAFRRVISVLFAIGLTLVAIEDVVDVNKSAVMLILASSMWVFTAARYHPTASEEGHERFHHHLDKGLQDVGGIVLFLLPAMAVVESVDHFGGFGIVTALINRAIGDQRHRLMPLICLLSFFMSSVIDNLTATIVALKILRHVAADDDNWRQLCGGLVVIAANAGGAWSPIGDVTTTMLWIQNKITVTATVTSLFVPSLVAGVAPLAGLWWQACREARNAPAGKASADKASDEVAEVPRLSIMVLILGICCILMVPVLKMGTGLPPYLGMLFALGVVWVVTECMGSVSPEEREENDEEEDPEMYAREGSADALEKPKAHPEAVGHGGVPAALHKVDLTGLLFFTGVLLAVVALDAAGVLQRYATWMMEVCGNNPVMLSSLLGVSSAIVDNVPLVEASIDMFENPTDDPLWQLVALAAGTGGSILSIGSIAGVTFMSMEGVGFMWYVRKVSLWAAIGFALGIATFEGQRRLTGI